jgi:CTP:molybdopterin cytidylyltransferase MocA
MIMGCILKQGGGLYSRVSIGAVLLAAGQGSRMGNQPKALLNLQGVPLINRHMIALSGAGVDEVVVVTGFYHDQVEPSVEQFPVQIIRNLTPENGQPSSVRLGIETIGTKYDAVIMMLCDQPLVNAEDITSLISAFKKRLKGEILIPRFEGQRGNPIIFSRVAIERMLANDKNMYCRKFIDQNPNLITYFDVQNDHFTVDIDTIDDIDNFNQTTGWSLTLPKDTLPHATLPEMVLTTDSIIAQNQHDVQADGSHHQTIAEPAYLALRRKLTPH